MSRRVVFGTPVRTGHAKANWRASLNVPQLTEIPGQDPSGAPTAENAAVVAGLLRLGMLFFLSNSVPYINQLNQGRSSQAGAGWIQREARKGARDGQLGQTILPPKIGVPRPFVIGVR